jgi:formylglycine-generating enzyme required for sulfatase activity
MKKNRMLLAPVLALAALMFAACPSPTDDDGGGGPVVTGVTVSPPTESVNKGGTQTFTATVEGTGNPPQTVTWKVEGSSAGTAIDNVGVLAVALDETPGTLTITATSTVDTGKSGTATVTVSNFSVTVDTVTVNPGTTSVNKGGTQTFTATVAGTGNPAQTVTWKVEGGIAGTTISAGGILTVAAGETATSLTVTATSTVDNSKSGTGTVTVLITTTPSYKEMVLATPNATDSVTITGNSAYYYGSADYYKGVFIEGRTVTLSPFSIAKYETTYELWYEVYQWATSHGYTFANPGREGHDGSDGAAPTSAGTAKYEPVTYINWRDTVVWCNAYSEMSAKDPVYYTDTGYGTILRVSTNTWGTDTAADKAVIKPGANGYRLPTEAEWEYAACGGKAPSPTGSFAYKWAGTNIENDLKDYAWYSSNSGYATHPVGVKEPNGLGLFDMSGNVDEWCWDWYDTVSGGTVTDPAGPGLGVSRVYRGGCWYFIVNPCAVADRMSTDPIWATFTSGFRVVARP